MWGREGGRKEAFEMNLYTNTLTHARAHANASTSRADRANWGDKGVEGVLVDGAEGGAVKDGMPRQEKTAYDREGELIRSIFPEYQPGMMSSGCGSPLW